MSLLTSVNAKNSVSFSNSEKMVLTVSQTAYKDRVNNRPKIMPDTSADTAVILNTCKQF